MKKILLCATILLAMVLSGCQSSKKIAYFQDVDSLGNIIKNVTPVDVRVQPGDKIFIMVKAQGGQELNELFSIMNGSSYNITADENSPYGYTVTESGDVDFPVIGKVHVAGLTRSEIESTIKQIILSQGQAKSVVVNVTFMNLSFSVMGEVLHPGRFTIDRDQFTITDAISKAGDLTIYGKRKNVMLIRKEGDHQQVYKVDLTNAEKLMTSPAYYIRQNDIIYIEPNTAKAQNSEIGSMTSLWLTLASMGLSIATLVVSITK